MDLTLWKTFNLKHRYIQNGQCVLLSDGIIYKGTLVIFYHQRLGHSEDANSSGYTSLKCLSFFSPSPIGPLYALPHGSSLCPTNLEFNHCHQTSTLHWTIHELLGKTPWCPLGPFPCRSSIKSPMKHNTVFWDSVCVVTSPSVAMETEHSHFNCFHSS